MNDHECQAAVYAELTGGENLIWRGQPSAKEMAKSGRGVFIIGIGLLLLSLCYIGLPFVLFGYDEVFMKYFFLVLSLPGFFISLRMIAAPMIEKRKAALTVYAVTTQRAMIIVTGKVKRVLSYYPGEIISVNHKINDDGSGNLMFTLNPKLPAKNPGSGIKNAFLGIPEVQVVELYLRDFLMIPQSKT